MCNRFFRVYLRRAFGVLLCLVMVQMSYAQTAQERLEARLDEAVGPERAALLVDLVQFHYPYEPEQARTYGWEAHALLAPTSPLLPELYYWMARAGESFEEPDSMEASMAMLRQWADAYDTAARTDVDFLEARLVFVWDSPEAAQEPFEAVLAAYEQQADTIGVARTYMQLGHIHEDDEAHALAGADYTRALRAFEAMGDRDGIAESSLFLGAAYYERAVYDSALVAYTRSADLYTTEGHLANIGAVLNELGNLYDNIGRTDEALNFYQRALDAWTVVDYLGGVADAIHSIGLVYEQLDENELALEYYQRALALEEILGSNEDLAITLNTIGGFLLDLGRPEEARPYFERALPIAQEVNFIQEIASIHLNIGSLYMGEDRLEEALEEMDLAGVYFDSLGILDFSADVDFARAEVLERMGRYQEALVAYKAFSMADDSLRSFSTQAIFAQVEQQFRTREQAQEIELLNQNQQIQRLWLGVLGGGAVLLVLIAGLVYMRYRDKNKAHATLKRTHATLQATHNELQTTQARLVQQEKLASLGQLTAGIAHEIKNPLNFINNFAEVNAELADELEEALADGDDPADIIADLRQNATVIAQHGKRADSIVRNMMAHARSGSSDHVPTDLNALVNEHIDLAYHGKRATMPGYTITIERDLDETIGKIAVVPQDIGRVILNLLSNAFDAILEAQAPRVTVSMRREGGQVVIRVADNGPGIPEDVQAKIFEPFFTTKPTGQGTGLGLSLSYDIVTQGHGGTMTVDSQVGRGATFSVFLPIDLPSYQA